VIIKLGQIIIEFGLPLRNALSTSSFSWYSVSLVSRVALIKLGRLKVRISPSRFRGGLQDNLSIKLLTSTFLPNGIIFHCLHRGVYFKAFGSLRGNLRPNPNKHTQTRQSQQHNAVRPDGVDRLHQPCRGCGDGQNCTDMPERRNLLRKLRAVPTPRTQDRDQNKQSLDGPCEHVSRRSWAAL
jgi:hypothetical protein